jgi:hypothetical protein
VKFYSIKRIETDGIREIEGEVEKLRDGEYYVWMQPSACNYGYEKLGRDCWPVRADAVKYGIAKLQKARESVSRRSHRITARIGELCGEVTDGAL